MKVTKNETIFYLLTLIILFLGGLFLMAGDNLSWITASGEWSENVTVCNSLDCWTGAVQDYNFGQKLDYIFRYRVYTVFTHPRDLIPVSLIAFGITLFIFLGRELLFKGKFLKKFVKWIG